MISQAASDLDINYSTAKSILLNFKKIKMYQCDSITNTQSSVQNSKLYNTRATRNRIKYESEDLI